MPTDHHGFTHAGALGLFDDEDEKAVDIARAERHEIADINRHEERRTKRKLRKQDKAGQCDFDGTSHLSRPMSWLRRLHSGSKDSASRLGYKTAVDEKSYGSDEEKTAKMPIHLLKQWAVVRRPATPDAVHTAQDVDPVDSPFLRECGMVRVKSDDAGRCHIVPKSTVQKSD